MDFKGKSSIEDLIKTAQVEVLLSSIKVDPKGTTVTPVKCPAVGRKNDYLKDMNGNPSCTLAIKEGTKFCEYFELSQFDLEDYTKKIMCNAVNLEDVKEKE